MRPVLTRAEMRPIETGQWKVILSVTGDAPDVVLYCNNKDHALHVVSVYLEATGKRLPKKPNWDRPSKVIYYFK